MALSPGTRLGHYEVVAPLGAGGMGEVYRARDTRLDRTVALKVLPADLSQDPERRQRFEREAKTISSLNHPNICTLHDIGRQEGIDYLVLEHLEGESLAARLEKGPLPLEQALRCGAEIADALARAHDHGVVHRDLKPGNVFLTRSGAKLLDFGLAKLAPALTPLPAPGLSALATEEKPLTEAGTVMGTYPYMSPEQLEGKEADARSDVFALGAVLYEMLTGKRAFGGKSAASVIAAVLGSEPPAVSQVRPMTPAALDHVVRLCLAKDPEERWQSAGDVARELKWIAEGGATSSAGEAVRPGRGRRLSAALGWMALGGLAVGLAVAGARLARREAPAPLRAVRTTILPPAGTSVRTGWGSGIALSPDGRNLVYVGWTAEGDSMLFLRALDSLEARPLPGTQGGYDPFWSPDGREIAFLAEDRLKRMNVAGGMPHVVAEASLISRGGIWLSDGTLVFDGVYRVAVQGGAPSTLPHPFREFPSPYGSVLPDGRHLLVGVERVVGGAQGIAVLPLDGGALRYLSRFEDPTFARVAYGNGFAVFNRGDTLFAQRLDVRRLALEGEGFPIVRGVSADLENWNALFSLSSNGILAYIPGSARLDSRLTWYDRGGTLAGTVGPPARYNNPELSGGGRQLLVDVVDESVSTGAWRREIVLLPLDGATPIRLTPDVQHGLDPVMSPDGARVAFGVYGKERNSFVVRELEKGTTETLLTFDNNKWLRDWSPDGRYLLYDSYPGDGNPLDIWALPLDGDRRPFPFRATAAEESQPAFSPDGRFVAYTSNETGRREVYVAPFPGPGGTQTVTLTGGRAARWRGDGRELFYLSPSDDLMAVDVRTTAKGLEFGEARKLFRIRPKEVSRNPYDVTPDGQRFVVNTLIEENPPIVLVQNWAAELAR